MTPDQAADLAARTLAAIDADWLISDEHSLTEHRRHDERTAADRERVASDLAGLRECYVIKPNFTKPPLRPDHAQHAARYAAGLRRTAALYGITEETT